MPHLAADLAAHPVAVIAATAGLSTALAAKNATTTLPIVFNNGSDPVKAGLVASINKPGGNVTGISTMNFQLGTKWLGLLHELLPGTNHYALLVDSAAEATFLVADVQAAATAGGFAIDIFHAGTMSDIETALSSAAQTKVGALMIAPGPVFLDHRVETAALALRLGLPALYTNRAFAEVGGAYSPDRRYGYWPLKGPV